MKRIIDRPNFTYTTYDSKNPIDVAYSILDSNDGESISTVKHIAFELWNYCNPFGKDVLRALQLFNDCRNDEILADAIFNKCFDNWCVNNNIKVYDKCKKCGKQIYVFDMWGTRKDITEYCFNCEQDNKVLLK